MKNKTYKILPTCCEKHLKGEGIKAKLERLACEECQKRRLERDPLRGRRK